MSIELLPNPPPTLHSRDSAEGPSELRPLYVLLTFGAAAGLTAWIALLTGAAFSELPGNDFCRFYYSTRAYCTGADMYGWNASVPAKIPSLLDGKMHKVDLWNMNPPHFHLSFLPLALVSAPVALGIWLIGGLLATLLALRIIFREVGVDTFPEFRQIVLLSCLAGVAIHVTIITGQVSFYLLLLVTLAWAHARRAKWSKAGVWLGVATAWKPFLLIFLPYLVAQRQWRCLFSAAGAVILSVALGAAVFGTDSYRSWLSCLGQSENWSWLHINASLWGALTRSFSESLIYVPVANCPLGTLKLVWFGLGGLLGTMTFAVAIFDSSACRVDRAFALLFISSLLLSPLGWNYYWVLPLGPLAAVAASWKQQKQSAPLQDSGWPRVLLSVAILGWYAPVYVTQLFQPSPIATVTIGNSYFWATLSLWLVLVIDGSRYIQLPEWIARVVRARKLAAPQAEGLPC